MIQETEPRPNQPVNPVKKAVSDLMDIPIPQKINRNSYEYGLAKYYFYLWRQETRDHETTKQEAQAADQALQEYATAYEGMDRSQMTAQKIADDRTTAILAACDDIDTLRKKRMGKLFQFTKTFALTIIALVCLWQFFTNQTLRQEILDKAIPLAILGIVGLVAYYFLVQKRK